MYSIVVEVVYCAGNNASLLRLLLMNTATSTALHCADLSHCTLQKLRSRRCRQSSRFFSIRPLLCMCVLDVCTRQDPPLRDGPSTIRYLGLGL